MHHGLYAIRNIDIVININKFIEINLEKSDIQSNIKIHYITIINNKYPCLLPIIPLFIKNK